jgi:hypothetical protein
MRWLLIGLIALTMIDGGSGLRRAADPGRSPAAGDTPASPRVPSSIDEAPDDLRRFAELALAVSGASPTDEAPDDLDEEDLATLMEQPLRWHTDYETVLALSERSGKPILARFR